MTKTSKLGKIIDGAVAAGKYARKNLPWVTKAASRVQTKVNNAIDKQAARAVVKRDFNVAATKPSPKQVAAAATVRLQKRKAADPRSRVATPPAAKPKLKP